jgi:tRNA pseudouridine38-40 synthase
LNAILPADIVVKRIFKVDDNAHSRFDAISREYCYYIYHKKDPFLQDTAYFFPYTLDVELMNEAAKALMEYTDFTSFSKRNTQVHTYECAITQSSWVREDNKLVYNVISNRFLRGMVKGLVGTMLQVGRGKLTIDQFKAVIEAKDVTQADFAVPSHGLFLVQVKYP